MPIGKLGAWYLLMMLSFVLVSLVHRPRRQGRGSAPIRSSCLRPDKRIVIVRSREDAIRGCPSRLASSAIQLGSPGSAFS